MKALNPRNSRAEAESMYISVMKDADVSMEEVREAIGLLLNISKGGRKNLASAPEEKISKLLKIYAKSVLSQEKYDAIGEEYIGEMDQEKIDAIGEHLPLNMIVAMTGERLAHNGMNAHKIINLSFMGTVELVKKTGPESIALINENGLNALFSEDLNEITGILKDDFTQLSKKLEDGLLQKNTGINISIKGYEFEIYILEANDDHISYGLFFPGQEYSRRTVSLFSEGNARQIREPATREGIGEMSGDMSLKGKSISLVPSSDITDNEPEFVMRDRVRTLLVTKTILQ